MATHSYEPTGYLDPESKEQPRYGLVILSQWATEKPPRAFEHLWHNAMVRVCSDGGANLLYKWAQHLGRSFVPDVVHGDLDSLSQEARGHFSSHHCPIVQDQDQNSTDFTKCVRYILANCPQDLDAIWVVGDLSGRFDHSIGMMQTLYLFPSMKIYILSCVCITFLVSKGHTQVALKRSLVGEHIGLLPIGHHVSCIKTTGLKWNLNGEPLEFGRLISTSNTFSDSEIEFIGIDTSEHIIFTMSLQGQ